VRPFPFILAGVYLLTGVGLSGCKPPIHPEDSEAKIIGDTDSVCAWIGAGNFDQWHGQDFVSKTWRAVKVRAAKGEAKADCDAAKLLKLYGPQTRTCTQRVVISFKRSTCD